MSKPPAAFKAMFDDIAMDLEWPLHHPEILPDGGKFYRDIAYATVRGFRPLMLDVSTPPGVGPHPVIVFIHGGAWVAGHPAITNPIYRKLSFFRRFHAAGFAVARISYRLSAEAKFPTQLHDCKSAIRFLRSREAILGLDSNRFGVMGDSAGGHLATLVGLTGKIKRLEGKVGETKGSSAVSCVVNWFGPTDFLTMQKQKRKLKSLGNSDAADSPESLLVGGPVQRRKNEARAASPITYVHKAAPPMLLQYGDKDRLVPFEQGLALFEALKAKHCEVTLQRIAGADHCFWGVEHDHVVDDDIAFFKKHLG